LEKEKDQTFDEIFDMLVEDDLKYLDLLNISYTTAYLVLWA